MLADNELDLIEELVFELENSIVEECDHEANICNCGVQGLVIRGYQLLHFYGKGEHDWVPDYEITSDFNLKPLVRCRKCYEEKSTA